MATLDWRGIYPAATTQFNNDLSLDMDATQRMVEQLITDGVHGLVMLGTVGENTVLSAQEKRTVVCAAVEVSNGRVPVISGVSEYTTEQAKQYARDCEEIGLDGLMALPPMVYKGDRRETVAHISATAQACSLPTMIYNNPGVYGTDLKPEVLVELSQVPNIVAVKESSEDPRRITDLHNLNANALTVMSGVDDVALESMLLGAVGWVTGFGNVYPQESVRIYDCVQKGKLDEALKIYRWMMPSLHMDVHPKLVQMIKLAEQIAGRGSELTRPPRLKLEGEERAHVTNIIETALANRPSL